MRLVFDIEATNLLNHESIDYTKYPFRLKRDFKVHCAVFKDIDSGKKFRFYQESLTESAIKYLLSKATSLIAHNGVGYDLPVFFLYFNVDYYIGSGKSDPSTLLGNPCEVIDTLIYSRALWPDRPSGHSLKEWGKRLGLLKGDYGQQEDAWSEFSEEMLDYCDQDVEVTHAVFNHLMEEIGEWPWQKALDMEMAIADIVFRQEHFGFAFDKTRAEATLKDLNEKLETIEKNVEPLLPEKNMCKTDLKSVTPPKTQFLKAGGLSKHMENFLQKVGGVYKAEEMEECVFVIRGKEYTLPIPNEPLWTTSPMVMSNQKDMKEYLVRLGWNPIAWGDNDLSIDTKKRKLDMEKYKTSVYRYCEETQNSEFKKYRLLHMKVKSVKELYILLMKKDLSRPVKVITSPKYTIDQDKTICPNLEKLGSKVDFVEDVVKWLTYRHRRNSILSPKGTGFLAQPRIEIDGRIQTPAITCGASTTRMLHKIVANIPRPTSLYGKPMRELFTVAEGTYQIGCDASGLEARVEAHYTKPYEGGEAYVEALLGDKPNDLHTLTSIKLGVSRDEAKTLKYAISYGAQPTKISKQMDWSLSKAKDIFEEFWDNAAPLKELKERVAKYWKTQGGGKFIKAIDGRKLYARSEHSLVNLLFQGCGSIIMKKSAILLDRDLASRGLLFNPFKDTSFKGKAASMVQYHDEGQLQVCQSLIEVKKGTEDEVKTFSKEGLAMSDISHVEEECWKGYSEVGVCMSNSIKDAAVSYNMKVPFGGDYQIGTSWASCH